MGERMRQVLPSVLSVLLALAVCWFLIAITRDVDTATRAYLQMLWGGVGNWPAFLDGGSATTVLRPLGEAAMKAALLTLTGLSVAVAFKVGLFNIGAQGQMIWGALAAALVGAHVSLPGLLHVPLALIAAALAGAAWASIAGVLKLKRGVHEVISTIMLNWVAVSLVDNWLVIGPLRAVAEGASSITGTAEILPTAQLPRLLGDSSRLNLGFPLALAAAFGVWVWLTRSRSGYETRAVGLTPEAARAAGIPTLWRAGGAMALAGALAGLAGAVLVLGTEGRYPGSLGAPYGFDGIAIALIGNNHPLGAALSAAVFGVLRAGGTRMQLLGVHKSFPELIQGFALLFVAGRMVWLALLERRQKRAQAQGPAQAGAEVPRV
ncbi:ABC transporter permease [Corallococcus exiguus]|uniref:ABC transporter permease n=1 Tax=Corallococcus TaxID=83461 RepID=UPI000EE06A43|nr:MULTISPECIES: ABC transporter permease [Corallococcus]NNB89355.1 ABC transporter permease [Corallococcus exiguus]NNC05992.1 ABC transporter permease [Corallococcus exiguus]NPC50824.1 ABC transporter permease [Corallococcus exiguus]RKH78669.1 ABC transporter permease [Corallococcus sp. AB032C]